MMNKSFVVKINTALSNKPLFVKIGDPDTNINEIFTEAIDSLKNTGRPLESQQLEQLYNSHQIFNAGKTIEKGFLFNNLTQTTQNIGNQKVVVAELDLVTSHSGGNNKINYYAIIHKITTECKKCSKIIKIEETTGFKEDVTIYDICNECESK